MWNLKAICLSCVLSFLVHPSSPRCGRVVVAVFPYEAREVTDVSFLKGDRMEVLDDRYEDMNSISNGAHCAFQTNHVRGQDLCGWCYVLSLSDTYLCSLLLISTLLYLFIPWCIFFWSINELSLIWNLNIMIPLWSRNFTNIFLRSFLHYKFIYF
jgi:hypothetical protein